MKSVVLALAFGAVLVGCETAVSDDEDRSSKLTQQDWVADTINGKEVIHPGRVTLTVAEGRVSGRGGCNLYSGPAEIGRGTIKVGMLISTKMACVDNGLMQQESIYLSALESAQRYSFGGDGKLTITTAAGALVYHGEPRQQRPEGS